MPTLGFSHYNFRAPRETLDGLRDFYCQVVGLVEGQRPPFNNFGYWLYAGERAVLHLSESGPQETCSIGVKGTFDHAAFDCRGRAETEDRLARLGVPYRVAVVPLTGLVQLFMQDPAGNGVELNFSPDDL
jgi:catechol-2,3-dioxygenase